MLQEVIDVQNNAVKNLVSKINSKKEITFRAPTGSGKTRMMADFMNRIRINNPNVIFLVSTLSKGNLAKQNYDVFKECYDKKIYPELIDETKTRKAVHITMLTTYGLKRNMYTDIIQNEVTLQDLFR